MVFIVLEDQFIDSLIIRGVFQILPAIRVNGFRIARLDAGGRMIRIIRGKRTGGIRNGGDDIFALMSAEAGQHEDSPENQYSNKSK